MQQDQIESITMDAMDTAETEHKIASETAEMGGDRCSSCFEQLLNANHCIENIENSTKRLIDCGDLFFKTDAFQSSIDAFPKCNSQQQAGFGSPKKDKVRIIVV